MQTVQKTLTQYGLRSQSTRQAHEDAETNMAATVTSESQSDTTVELVSIKMLLQSIASDMNGLKSGMDAVQTAVEKLGVRMTEAETRISALEDRAQTTGKTVDAAATTIKQLQEKVTYLEDAGRRNNVRIVGAVEGAEGRDIKDFVKRLCSEILDLEMTQDFEIERAHRTGQRGARPRHILVRFLRLSAREAVLRAARDKDRVEWQGKRLSFFQDLSQDIIQRRKKFDGVKKRLQEKGMRYTMTYPAVLRVIADNIRHTFVTPDEVENFISSRAS